MRWCYLGRVDYEQALQLQQRLKEAVAADAVPDTLLLLEHPAVITLGRSGRADNVLAPPAALAARGVQVRRVSRGGDVTYHGPGQLVGYPVRRVGRQVHAHVQGMADALVAVLGRWGIAARWEARQPGVWTAEGKIAAVGVDARGGVATHGLALNVRPHLEDYHMIVPCGLSAPVTSMAALLGEAATPGLEEVAPVLAEELGRRYGSPAEWAAPQVVREVES